jgi:hypothetical protein
LDNDDLFGADNLGQMRELLEAAEERLNDLDDDDLLGADTVDDLRREEIERCLGNRGCPEDVPVSPRFPVRPLRLSRRRL